MTNKEAARLTGLTPRQISKARNGEGKALLELAKVASVELQMKILTSLEPPSKGEPRIYDTKDTVCNNRLTEKQKNDILHEAIIKAKEKQSENRSHRQVPIIPLFIEVPSDEELLKNLKAKKEQVALDTLVALMFAPDDLYEKVNESLDNQDV